MTNPTLLSVAEYLKAWCDANNQPLPPALVSRLDAVKARTKYLPDPHAHVKLQAEQHLAAAMTTYFTGLQDRIAAWAETRKGIKSIPAAQFWAGEDKTLLAVLQPHLTRMAYSGMHIAAEKVGIAFDNSMANKAAADWAAEYTDTLLQQLDTTTQDGVGPIIEDWINTDGATMGDLFQSLMDTKLMGADRASMIATTETTRAFAQGEIAQYSQAGITRMRWNTDNDEVVCDICEPLNGEVRTIGEEYGDGITEPPGHVNCRCWLTPVVGEKHIKMAEGTDAGGGFWVNPDDPNQPFVRTYGTSGDITAFIVNGRYVRNNTFLDFTMGGNHERYEFVPENEIWIDNANIGEADFILLHELVESREMRSGKDYDTAHDIANKVESKARDNPELLPALLAAENWK